MLVYVRPSGPDGVDPEEMSSVGFVVVAPGYFAGVRMGFMEIAPIEEVRNGFRIDGSLDMITAPDVRRFMEEPGPLVLDWRVLRFCHLDGIPKVEVQSAGAATAGST
jgi:hypothetical protein